MKVRLTYSAQQDVEDLRRFTEEVWGHEQATLYLRRLEEKFRELLQRPRSGETHPHMVREMRSVRVGQHIVFFVTQDGRLVILRVLNYRRVTDALRYERSLNQGANQANSR